MPLLSRDAILGAPDRKTEDVDVPEWGGTVRIRSLSGTERDAFEASMVQINASGGRQVKLENIRARLVALTAVDEEGERLFSDKDVKELGQKSAAALDRVWDASQRLSGLSDEDVQELAEDLEDAPSDGSISDSHLSSV
jgi:hypothetical protein